MLLCLFHVGSISQDANSELGLGWGRQTNGSSETLVLGVVVLQTDLEFDCLGELALLLSAFLENFFNVLTQQFA